MIDSFTLADVRDWIRTLGVGLHFYVGKINNKQEQSVGVYERPSYTAPDISSGGLDTTKTMSMQVSLLIHWNKNSMETDQAARELYGPQLKIRCDIEELEKVMDKYLEWYQPMFRPFLKDRILDVMILQMKKYF